jgi:alkyldihydroxyacetonephosphate synthase
VLRLSDEVETAIGLVDPKQIGSGEPQSGCLLVVRYEGSAASVAGQREGVAAVLRDAGGEPLGDQPGERWAAGRYAAPYLRDALLDVGAFAETLETATFWSNLPRLYAAVRDALTGSLTEQGALPLVLCHVSHVYPAGASLYFTVVCAQGDDPVPQWRQAKTAASEAIIAAGGTISHHHGVGTDHRDWLEGEIGLPSIEILRAVKQRLDPAGILNPGVLVP